ncbi:MAG: GNAT family N-acetyltransferase, partial [Armatimonadota bacterium]
ETAMQLPPDRFPAVIDALGENTRTVIPFHFVLRRTASVWADDALQNVVIRTAHPRTQVFVFGDDAGLLLDLIGSAGRARLYWVPEGCADEVERGLREWLGDSIDRLPDVQRTVDRPVDISAPSGVDLRRLTTADLPLLDSAHGELHWLYETWGDWERLLDEGILVGAIVDGDLASAGVTFARAAELDDIGVATVSTYQRCGFSTACAALLVREILAEGRRPVWTVFVENTPSLRISEKLGFRTMTRCVVFRPHGAD